MPDISLHELSLLSLKPGSRVLMYGTSFLRELIVNILLGTVLAHGASSFCGGQQLEWTGWQPPGTEDALRQGLFPGCIRETDASFAKTRQLANIGDVLLNATIKGHAAAHFNFAGERSLTMVVNYPPLQNPTCHAELHKFLELGSYDAVVFMTPHGDSFDQYQALRAVNKKAPPPINFATVVTNQTEFHSLAEIFAGLSPFVVHVPSIRARDSSAVGPVTVNRTLLLSSYANHDGGYCGEPDCSSTDGSSHQCNPGDFTIAAWDLMQMLRAATGQTSVQAREVQPLQRAEAGPSRRRRRRQHRRGA